MLTTRILFLENGHQQLKQVTEQLADFGYTSDHFFHAQNLREVQSAQAAAFSPKLIFASFTSLDCNTVIEDYRHIQQAFPQVPVIVLSRHDSDELAIQCVEAGVQSFLPQQSFTPSQLHRLIAFSRIRSGMSRQLHQLKTDYQSVFEKNGLPMLIADMCTRRMVAVNEAAVHFYQYQPPDFCQMKVAQLGVSPLPKPNSHPCNSPAFIDKYRPVFHYKKNGEPVYVNLTENNITYQGRESLLITVNDITATITAACEEEKTRQRLDAVFNGTHDIIFLADDQGRIQQVNKAATECLGYSEAELLNMSVANIAMPPANKTNDNNWNDLLKTWSQTGSTQFSKKNGYLITCHYNITANVLPGLHLAILSDVTSEEINGKKIEEQSKRIEDLLNSINQGFATVDSNWNISYWNKAAENITGIKKESILGSHLWQQFNISPELDFYRHFQKAMNQQVSVQFEDYYPPLRLWSYISVYPVKEGLAVFFTDITQAKKQALEIQEARNNQLALINSTSHFIWSVNENMQLISFNKAYEERLTKVLSHPPAEGLQLPINLHSKANHKEWQNHYSRALQGNSFTIQERIIVNSNAESRLAEITFNPIYAAGGEKIKGVACYAQDITQLEHTRQLIAKQDVKLNHSKQHLQKLTSKLEKIMNSSIDVICSIDRHGNFIQVSNASLHVWGYQPGELVGISSLKLVAPEYTNATRKAAINIMSGAIYTDFQNEYLHKKGHRVPLMWSAKWEEEEQTMFCVARDASALREAAQMRVASEERITALLQNGADIIGIIDEEIKYCYISPNIKSLLGYDPDSLLKTSALSLVHPEDRNATLQELKKVATHGKVKLAAFRYKNAFGDWRWIETVATNQLTNPAIRGIVISSRDITSRKQIETEREMVIKELLKSNADLKQFSFITSHNLRAPLSNITGILNILEYDQIDEYNRNMLVMLEKSVKQLRQTIDDLSRILIVKNNVNVEIADIELNASFEQVNSVFISTLQDLNAEVTTDFGLSHIHFNPTYFESILVNLISNAIKYRSNERRLSIHISSHSDGEGNIVLKFADNGIGIDMKLHREKLFGLYQRFHDNIEGHGLGLFIIKSQIVALGGNIELQSEINKGTTFIITLKKDLNAQMYLSYA